MSSYDSPVTDRPTMCTYDPAGPLGATCGAALDYSEHRTLGLNSSSPFPQTPTHEKHPIGEARYYAERLPLFAICYSRIYAH